MNNYKRLPQSSLDRNGLHSQAEHSPKDFMQELIPNKIRILRRKVIFNAEFESEVHFDVMRHLASLFDADVKKNSRKFILVLCNALSRLCTYSLRVLHTASRRQMIHYVKMDVRIGISVESYPRKGYFLPALFAATFILGWFLYCQATALTTISTTVPVPSKADKVTNKRRRLRIAEVSSPVESVPPKGYGGLERVVYYLVEELVKQGHKVTLFAPPESNTSAAELITNKEWEHLNRKDRVGRQGAMRGWQLDQLKLRSAEFDIIHFHYTEDQIISKLDAKTHTKIVATLHWLVSEYFNAHLWSDKKLQLVSISNDQMTHLPDKSLKPNVVNIYHGLPPNLYQFKAKTEQNRQQPYLVYMNRIIEEKGADSAIQIAVRAGIRLKIASKTNEGVDSHLWQNVIKPMLDKHPDLVEIVGEISDTQKSEFLGNALALLFPIRWNEPFGLVMIEAMACGTPVVARRRGSVPEIVDQNITGLVFDTDEQAVEAVKRVHTIDRAGVRRRFEQRFTAKVMAENYAKLFERMVDRNARDPPPYPTVV